MSKKAYWLAHLDRSEPGPGRYVLDDGEHGSPAGVAKARYLIESLGLGQPNREFVMLTVEPVKASSKGVNHGAVGTIKRAMRHLSTAK